MDKLSLSAPTIDSREVAQMVGKSHGHLLRDIDSYGATLIESNFGFNEFFTQSTYKDSIGRTLPCYLVTKKGCELIAHKLTGKKGVLFTASYINRFHELEESVNGMVVKESEPTNNLAQLLRENATCLIKLADMVDLFGNQEKYAYPLRNTAWILSAELTHSLDTTGPVMKYVGE